ncbi:hypothetical protein ACFWAR_01085 [Streptomyces sp. NPDC059917]|uniref:hypothetical protein n=1 Tax=Streptomyces sp. NPDC059917 TaxID=3347002 RepID=UPI00364B6E83
MDDVLAPVRAPENGVVSRAATAGPGAFLHQAPHPEVTRRLPAPARPAGTAPSAEQAAGSGGPGVSEAVYWLFHVKQLVHRTEALRERVELLDGARGWDPSEASGTGARYGADLLAAAIQDSAPPPSAGHRPRPQSAAVSAIAWAHAVCGVRAEAALSAERATATAASFPSLAEALTELAEACGEVFRQMAAAECFTSWSTTLDPLYRAWLSGSLSSMPAPPPYFPDRTGLYRARPALAREWEQGDDWGPAGGGLPQGSLERYVPDTQGDPWALILAAPGYAADPRDWPEPSAVLIAANASAQETRCYLLAEEVVAVHMLPLIGRGRGRDQLEDVAAAVWLPGGQRDAEVRSPLGSGPGALTPAAPWGLPREPWGSGPRRPGGYG